MQPVLKREILRKLLHLSSLWMPLAILWLPRWQAFLLFAALLTLMLFFEFSRRRGGKAGRLFLRFFARIMRSRELELGRLTGATYMLMAALLAVALLSPLLAFFGALVMVISDSVAALVGMTMGRRRIGNKTAEGSMAFLLSSLLIAATLWMTLDQPPEFFLATAVGALVATVLELFSERLKLDDNLLICLGAGGAAQLFYLL
jgi:dolichol kinase